MSEEEAKADKVIFEKTSEHVDNLIKNLQVKKEQKKFSSLDNIKFAHDIKTSPPEPGYMKVDVKPGIYSMDLNIDAHWWFGHSCTVFPLLLDQAKRTHIDIKDSFKDKKVLPDFNLMWVIFIIIGLMGVFLVTKFLGWW